MNLNSSSSPRYAIIIPVHNEEEVLGLMLDELQNELPAESPFVVAVGLNATHDNSRAVALQRGVVVGETEKKGYGHGCLAAIAVVNELDPPPEAYLFMAGDGANDPRDLSRLTQAYEQGASFVMGSRISLGTGRMRPWHRNAANLVLGAWASLLSGHWFPDLGPFRLISRPLFDQIQPRECTWGWTIEAQIAAARLGHRIHILPLPERPRMAGEQKVSGVSLRQTLAIGWAIARAGWRVSRRKYSPQT